MSPVIAALALSLGSVAQPEAQQAPGPVDTASAEPSEGDQGTWDKLPGGQPPPHTPAARTGAPEPLLVAPLDAETDAEPGEPAPAPTVWKRHGAEGPRTSRPIRWRIDPFVDVGTLVVVDPGYRLFDDNRSLTQIGAGLRADGRIGRGPLRLGGGVHYGYAGADAAPHQGALFTELDMHGVIASIRASIVLIEGIDVTGALEAGPQFARAYLDSDTRSSAPRRVLGAFAAKAGVALYLPKQFLPRRGASRFTFGLTATMGYALHTAWKLRPTPAVADDAVRTVGTSFGDLRMHGYVWSLGLFARFM